MLKVYKTDSYLSMPIKVKGKWIRIEFRGNKFTGGFFSTKEKDVQKSIESSPKFNRSIYLYSEEIKSEPSTQSEEKEKIESVNTYQDAAAYLKEKGVIATTPEEIRMGAEKLNVSFPKLKL